MPTLEQNGQVRSSRAYLDNVAAGSGMETPAGLSLEEDANALRSQLKRIMDPVGATKWHQSMAAAGFDSFGLKQIHDKAFVFRSPVTPGTNDFTLGGAASGVLVDAAKIVGGSGTIAVGPSSANEGGHVAADEALFLAAGALNVGLSQAKDADGILLNKVELIDDATNEPPSDGGVTVFGLLQCVAGTGDGTAIGAALSENLQISFVKIDAATDVLTAVSLPAADYHFGLPRQRQFFSLSRGAIVSGVDALPDAIGPSATDLRLPFRHFDLLAAVAALDPLNIQTGVFTTAGATTVFASFGTPILPATGPEFRDDSRVKIWRNGNLQSKGSVAGDNKDCHRISNTQIAFRRVLNPTESIVLESPAS